VNQTSTEPSGEQHPFRGLEEDFKVEMEGGNLEGWVRARDSWTEDYGREVGGREPCKERVAQAYAMTMATFINPRYQHDRGSSVVHGSTLQNYVYPNPRPPNIDASQETEASKIDLDRSTENPRPNYARACLATPRKKHMDTSISTDESELFEAPSVEASPRIKASTESPIPAESKRNPRSASYMKGRYIVLKAPKKVRDEAQKALTAALDQVPATIHFDQRGKRTTATLYVGNLEFKASTKDLKDALDALKTL
jgi:hypothetical protein